MSQDLFFSLKMEWFMNASFFLEQLKHYVQAARVHKAGQAFLLFYCSTLEGFPWCAVPTGEEKPGGKVFHWHDESASMCPSFWNRKEDDLRLRTRRLSRSGWLWQAHLPNILVSSTTWKLIFKGSAEPSLEMNAEWWTGMTHRIFSARWHELRWLKWVCLLWVCPVSCPPYHSLSDF